MSNKINAKLFIVSAPSGTGKSSLVTALLEKIGSTHSLERVITYTTKTPRITELPGIDYHFITDLEFKERIEQGFFIEYSQAYGTYYGSPVSALERLKDGISSIVIVDRVGAEQIKAVHEGAIMIWIYPPSLDVLRDRLKSRNTEKTDAIERRMLRAAHELAMEEQKTLYNFHIKNDNFSCALEKLEEIVINFLKIENQFFNVE